MSKNFSYYYYYVKTLVISVLVVLIVIKYIFLVVLVFSLVLVIYLNKGWISFSFTIWSTYTKVLPKFPVFILSLRKVRLYYWSQ